MLVWVISRVGCPHHSPTSTTYIRPGQNLHRNAKTYPYTYNMLQGDQFAAIITKPTAKASTPKFLLVNWSKEAKIAVRICFRFIGYHRGC